MIKKKKIKKKILIIGAGIHGSFLAKYLSNYNIDIFLLDKNSKICCGTSSATHNRANRGYHYPRSNITMRECIKSYDYFKKNYKRFLLKSDSYYCIENSSKVNFKKYQDIFRRNKLKFKRVILNSFIKSQHIEGVIKAEEGCFKHNLIVNFLNKKLNNKKIKKYLNFEVKKIIKKKDTLYLFSHKKEIFIDKLDFIVNATYENVNTILKMLNIKPSRKYIYQRTEVPVVFSKKNFPGITIMDGPFATIMPYASKKKYYLLYDVQNSILEKKNYINNIRKQKKGNYKKIIKKLKKYINFTDSFKYKYSLYGYRPIPINCKGDDRSTKFEVSNFKKTKIFSIYEGKYISAPYEMNLLAKKIAKLL